MLLSGIGTKPLKIIVATVYKRQGDNVIEVVRRRTKRKRRRNAKHSKYPATGHRREHSEVHADKQNGTHLQEMAAKLFVHGKDKQETNQLQKSMSVELMANYC